MIARIKISHFTQKLKTFGDNFVRQSFAPNIFGSETISLHYVALFSFDNQIWFYQGKNIIKHWSSCLPIVNRSCKFLLTGPSISRVFRTTKSIFKPYYKFLIAACDFKHAMPLKSVAIFALFYIANIQATFSINESSKISNLSDIMICTEFNYFTHDNSFVYNSIALNENKIHGERLSEKTPKGDAIV